jgi:hypothetical protein
MNENFNLALQGSDENSLAYCGAMRGHTPTRVSTASHPYLGIRLLKMRLIDIISSLEEVEKGKGKGRAVQPDILVSGLKGIVSCFPSILK